MALFSRAKGFNDSPNGFTDGYRLSDRANFGSCLKSYFNAQANDGGLTNYNIQRKRAYFWSMTGDWTVRLRNKNGLGLLGLASSLRSTEVHPNRAWIDGWHFDAALNHVRGVGDVDGDGIDEIVITSEWGIGLLKYDGVHFRALLTAPRDTWFGGWRYDATVNPGRDSIKGVGNFTGTSASEILVWSSWGIATLAYNGITLSTSRIHANGTRLGGWLLNTADNRFAGCGRFETEDRQDMVMMSPWGLGILSLESSSAVMMAPNGTRFGGWLLNTADNTIRLIADLDGDGQDEILISSPWGVGVLKLIGGTLTSAAMHPNGDNVDGLVLRNTHTFALADNLCGGGARQIVVTDGTGIHVLALADGRLRRLASAANGARVDGWVVDTSHDVLQRAGDMNNDGRAECVIRSPWGIGIVGVDAGNHLRVLAMSPHGSPLGDWCLESGDVIAGTGRLGSTAAGAQLLVLKS